MKSTQSACYKTDPQYVLRRVDSTPQGSRRGTRTARCATPMLLPVTYPLSLSSSGLQCNRRRCRACGFGGSSARSRAPSPAGGPLALWKASHSNARPCPEGDSRPVVVPGQGRESGYWPLLHTESRNHAWQLCWTSSITTGESCMYGAQLQHVPCRYLPQDRPHLHRLRWGRLPGSLPK